MSLSSAVPPPPLAVRERLPRLTKWVPDGAISVQTENSTLVLRASRKLQERFEELLAGRKSGTLSVEENQEYEAICSLDEVLSWLNRLVRGRMNG